MKPFTSFSFILLLGFMLAPGCCTTYTEDVSPQHFIKAAQARETYEKLTFRDDGSLFCYLDCYAMKGGHSSLRKVWTKRTHRSELSADIRADYARKTTNE